MNNCEIVTQLTAQVYNRCAGAGGLRGDYYLNLLDKIACLN